MPTIKFPDHEAKDPNDIMAARWETLHSSEPIKKGIGPRPVWKKKM